MRAGQRHHAPVVLDDAAGSDISSFQCRLIRNGKSGGAR